MVRTVVHNPGLFRIAIAYFAFSMAEFATWVAMLVYGYHRGGATTVGAVAAIQLIPCGLFAPFVGLAGIVSAGIACCSPAISCRG